MLEKKINRRVLINYFFITFANVRYTLSLPLK